MTNIMLDRKEVSSWYYKTFKPEGIYASSDAMNAAQNELYKVCKDNGIRIVRHSFISSNSSYWHIQEDGYNLLRVMLGNMIKLYRPEDYV